MVLAGDPQQLCASLRSPVFRWVVGRSLIVSCIASPALLPLFLSLALFYSISISLSLPIFLPHPLQLFIIPSLSPLSPHRPLLYPAV
jgi:hypothetical protein